MKDQLIMDQLLIFYFHLEFEYNNYLKNLLLIHFHLNFVFQLDELTIVYIK